MPSPRRFEHGDWVLAGTKVDFDIYWSLTRFIYLCQNTQGHHVVENPGNDHRVCLVECVRHMEICNGCPKGCEKGVD